MKQDLKVFESTTDIRPKLAPSVMDVWEGAGIYIESPIPKIVEQEIELFTKALVETLAQDLGNAGVQNIKQLMKEQRYIE